jgi:hypothetical protein
MTIKLKGSENIRQVAMVLCYIAKNISVCHFRSFTPVDFLSIHFYTFGRPPRPLLIQENTHYDTKLTLINVFVVLANLNFSWLKFSRAFEPMGGL